MVAEVTRSKQGDLLFLRDGGLESKICVWPECGLWGPEASAMKMLCGEEEEEKKCLEGKMEGGEWRGT